MVLADGESVVKEWHYAKSIEKKLIGEVKTKYSLTVTNKRIISTAASIFGISQSEVYLKDVSSVYSRTRLPSKILPIILLILGAAVIVAAIVAANVTQNPFLYILIALGVIFIIIGVVLLLRTGFELVIITDKLFGTSILAGASNLKRRKGAAIKVRVNRKVAFEIQDTIGAVILNEKASMEGQA